MNKQEFYKTLENLPIPFETDKFFIDILNIIYDKLGDKDGSDN